MTSETAFVWVTDPHFNFIKAKRTEELGAVLAKQYFDAHIKACIISGDIAEAKDVVELLKAFMRGWQMPVYFVLGNHDYYGGSISRVERDIDLLCLEDGRFIWLDRYHDYVNGIAVVGAGGWYDGVHGDAKGSRVLMSDFQWIDDLKVHFPGAKSWEWYPESRFPLLEKLQELAPKSVARGEEHLVQACTMGKDVIFVTHYPPYKEACWHEGKMSDNEWLPWFTCAAMGDMLDRVADAHPDNLIQVLCGHTHSSGCLPSSAEPSCADGRSSIRTPTSPRTCWY